MATIDKLLQRPVKAILGLFYPPQCPCCGQPVENNPVSGSAMQVPVSLCPDCWQEAVFIADPACQKCGAPIPGDGMISAPDRYCDSCQTISRPWEKGRAALAYSGTGRELILALKHRDRPDLAPVLGRWLSDATAPLIVPDMIVAPVPLHFRRLVKRKYNQAALLAGHLARYHRLSFIPDLLVRKRHTPMQDRRDIADRFVNVADAIGVKQRRKPDISGRNVLVVDDVMASGATLAAATECLQEAGVGTVYIATLARALKDD